MNRKWGLALLSLLVGCEHLEVRSPAGRYLESETLWRHGSAQSAIEAADKGWRQWKNKPASEWYWKFRLLEAEFLLNEDSVDRALALLEDGTGAPPAGELGVRYLADLGHARKNRAQVFRAFQDASREGYTSLIPAIELKRAALNHYLGRSAEYLRNAAAVAHAHSDPYMEASALLDLGFQRLYLSRFDEAIPPLERAISIAQSIGAVRVQDRALGNLGWCYSSLGDFDRAIAALTQAATLAHQVGDEDRRLRWLNNIGNVHYRLRQFDEAISNYQSAATLAGRTKDKYWLPITLTNLAAANLEKGDLPSAERFNEQAAALSRRIPGSLSLLHSQLHGARIEAARKQPRAEASFRAVIDSALTSHEPLLLWEAQGRLARQLQETGSAAEADTEYRNALATIENEWSKLGEDRHKVTFLAQLIAFYGDYVDFLVGRGEIPRAAAVADSSRARVISERLAEQPGGGRIEIRTRTSDTILLSYWLARDRSHLWLIGPKGVSHFGLPGEARIGGLVKRYRAAIEQGHDLLARENPAGRELFETLLDPARGLIPKGANVIVVPDGALHGLNFETLIVNDPKPHYWIEDVSVAVAPALGLLESESSRRLAPAKALFLGDPVMTDPAFPPLPHLKQEAEIIRRNFPRRSTLLAGKAAHPQAYRAAHPGDYNLIHFAAHAVANGESPLNSAVLLSDAGEGYKLYAKDVIDQQLQADLVTVSACHSAGAKSYAGEGLLGFTWAFLHAGAKNVIAGLWNADDEATAEIMDGFYSKLISGARPGESLRFAKLKLLRSPGPHRVPYYWGALQLFTRQFAESATPKQKFLSKSAASSDPL